MQFAQVWLVIIILYFYSFSAALTVQFDPNSYEVIEGGQASLRMVLSFAASVPVTVQWGTADDSATGISISCVYTRVLTQVQLTFGRIHQRMRV